MSDDIRDSPALNVAPQLQLQGAIVLRGPTGRCPTAAGMAAIGKPDTGRRGRRAAARYSSSPNGRSKGHRPRSRSVECRCGAGAPRAQRARPRRVGGRGWSYGRWRRRARARRLRALDVASTEESERELTVREVRGGRAADPARRTRCWAATAGGPGLRLGCTGARRPAAGRGSQYAPGQRRGAPTRLRSRTRLRDAPTSRWSVRCVPGLPGGCPVLHMDRGRGELPAWPAGRGRPLRRAARWQPQLDDGRVRFADCARRKYDDYLTRFFTLRCHPGRVNDPVRARDERVGLSVPWANRGSRGSRRRRPGRVHGHLALRRGLPAPDRRRQGRVLWCIMSADKGGVPAEDLYPRRRSCRTRSGWTSTTATTDGRNRRGDRVHLPATGVDQLRQAAVDRGAGLPASPRSRRSPGPRRCTGRARPTGCARCSPAPTTRGSRTSNSCHAARQFGLAAGLEAVNALLACGTRCPDDDGGTRYGTGGAR